MAGNAELPGKPGTKQGNHRSAGAGVQHAGNRLESLEQLPVETIDLGRRGEPALIYRQAKGEDMIRAHAEVSLRAVPEAQDASGLRAASKVTAIANSATTSA